MITEKDLQEAIAECHGESNPNANTCIKLAAFYTIQEHMYGGISEEPAPCEGITYQSQTEFSQAVYGKDADSVIEIVDDLMDALQVLCPRLYQKAMRHFRNV